MQVVLLAAGMGLRLGHLTRALPKAMIRLQGRPLIDHTLPHLLANRRVEEVIVVGGFEHAVLSEHLEQHYGMFGDRLRLLKNSDFIKGNLYTLEKALPFLDSSFLLCNVDHVFQENTWSFILQERESSRIFCDFFRPLAEDEMKVSLDEEKHLQKISKSLQSYDAGYVGLTYIACSQLAAYQEAVRHAVQQFGEKAVVENVLQVLADQGQKIGVVPFDRYKWHEIDTREELNKAESALSAVELLNAHGLKSSS